MSALWYRGAERLPADLALAIIPSLPRAQLERLAQKIIDHLDEDDGDTDLEGANGAEDEFMSPEEMARYADGPGCEISDMFGVQDEDGCNMPTAFETARRIDNYAPGCRFSDEDMDPDHKPLSATPEGREERARRRERMGLPADPEARRWRL